jgi:hypothetical protein
VLSLTTHLKKSLLNIFHKYSIPLAGFGAILIVIGEFTLLLVLVYIGLILFLIPVGIACILIYID